MLTIALLSALCGVALRWSHLESQRLDRESRSRAAVTSYAHTGGARRINH
jgi:hypothetical protein